MSDLLYTASREKHLFYITYPFTDINKFIYTGLLVFLFTRTQAIYEIYVLDQDLRS